MKRILSAGHNSALLRARNALIESAGYQVVTTKESNLLLQLVNAQSFDAVVLCNSIPAPLRGSIARQIKASKPTLPLVILCTEDEQERFQRLAEKLVVAEHGVSQPLIEAISIVAGEAEEMPPSEAESVTRNLS
jgi:CheY-like chemotaxis protein